MKVPAKITKLETVIGIFGCNLFLGWIGYGIGSEIWFQITATPLQKNEREVAKIQEENKKNQELINSCIHRENAASCRKLNDRI